MRGQVRAGNGGHDHLLPLLLLALFGLGEAELAGVLVGDVVVRPRDGGGKLHLHLRVLPLQRHHPVLSLALRLCPSRHGARRGEAR